MLLIVCSYIVFILDNEPMQSTQKQAQKQLGAVIRENREALELSQEALADLVGVHRTYMGSIERGEKKYFSFEYSSYCIGSKTQAFRAFCYGENVRKPS